MDDSQVTQFEAFLQANQAGDDPAGYIAALEQYSLLHPSLLKAKPPSQGRFAPDLGICKYVKATAKRPIVPWWWYIAQKEPVPSVVEDIYNEVAFDYVLVFPKINFWVYILVEPDGDVLDCVKKQDPLRAFIMMSIVNKNFRRTERDTRRVRLSKIIESAEINNIITCVVYDNSYELADRIPKNIPTVRHSVDATGTNWQIRYPGRKEVFWSFKELIKAMPGA
jgi:hypothetical protein